MVRKADARSTEAIAAYAALLNHAGTSLANSAGIAGDDWVVGQWSESMPMPSDEATEMLDEAVLIGGTQDDAAQAKQSLVGGKAKYARLRLLQRLRRDFDLGLLDLLRNHIVSSMGYLRVQSETAALAVAIAENPSVGSEWWDALTLDAGRAFHRKHNPRLRELMKRMGLDLYYQLGSEMAMHSRLAGIEEYEDRGYGAKPDIAIVHVKARGLPALQVDSEFPISEGIELATAGFPMGRDALTAPGWLHQITPTVQRGIVSASLPFPGAPLHGFTLNVMVQGGASGSPVFNPNTAAVVGLLYGSLTEWERTMHGGRIPMPTNISYVAPAHVIKRFIDEIERDNRFPAPNDAKTIEERVTTGQIVDRYEEMDIGNVRRASR